MEVGRSKYICHQRIKTGFVLYFSGHFTDHLTLANTHFVSSYKTCLISLLSVSITNLISTLMRSWKLFGSASLSVALAEGEDETFKFFFKS